MVITCWTPSNYKCLAPLGRAGRRRDRRRYCITLLCDDAGVAAGLRRSCAGHRHLLIQPNVLEARAVVDAIYHLRHPLHPRLVADRGAGVKEDRPDIVPDQLSFDVPDQLPPLLRVGLYRLPVDHRIDLMITVSPIVARGAAGV